MRARTLTLLLMIAVSLWGCATTQEEVLVRTGSTSMTCTSLNCVVTVKVGPGCAISTNGDTLTVRVPDEKEVLVKWRIEFVSGGTGAFTATGIDGKTGAWHSEFKQPTPGATEFTWVNKNKQKNKPFGYNAFVAQGGVTCKYDPIIINN